MTRQVRVLLVEDEALIREVVAELLDQAGFDVTATCTGDEAAILLSQDEFAILLADITMPGEIDGIGLAEHAREINPQLPIVLVSGRPENRRRVGHLAPPVAFFAKPYDIDALVAAVGRLTGAAA